MSVSQQAFCDSRNQDVLGLTDEHLSLQVQDERGGGEEEWRGVGVL